MVEISTVIGRKGNKESKMRGLILQEGTVCKAAKKIKDREKLVCPVQSDTNPNGIIYCTDNCAWFKSENDRTSPAINVYCKDYFMGILERG